MRNPWLGLVDFPTPLIPPGFGSLGWKVDGQQAHGAEERQ